MASRPRGPVRSAGGAAVIGRPAPGGAMIAGGEPAMPRRWGIVRRGPLRHRTQARRPPRTDGVRSAWIG